MGFKEKFLKFIQSRRIPNAYLSKFHSFYIKFQIKNKSITRNKFSNKTTIKKTTKKNKAINKSVMLYFNEPGISSWNCWFWKMFTIIWYQLSRLNPISFDSSSDIWLSVILLAKNGRLSEALSIGLVKFPSIAATGKITDSVNSSSLVGCSSPKPICEDVCEFFVDLASSPSGGDSSVLKNLGENWLRGEVDRIRLVSLLDVGSVWLVAFGLVGLIGVDLASISCILNAVSISSWKQKTISRLIIYQLAS